ncbi:hypothetical protein, partial [Allorhodopirellula solitaria]|uniref:hypothetical protein n=1 Tax=Allorhodopirellula solitaria TaxID=2527987 RepID=UPI001C98D1E6
IALIVATTCVVEPERSSQSLIRIGDFSVSISSASRERGSDADNGEGALCGEKQRQTRSIPNQRVRRTP